MEKENNKLKGAFVERDLSWMYFNHRILQEAEKKDIPVLERMTFLGIYSNNLDEFFRVRIASLNRIAQSKDKTLKNDRERAKRTIKDINHLNSCYNKEFEKYKRLLKNLNKRVFVFYTKTNSTMNKKTSSNVSISKNSTALQTLSGFPRERK